MATPRDSLSGLSDADSTSTAVDPRGNHDYDGASDGGSPVRAGPRAVEPGAGDFTLRAVTIGLFIGIFVCICNTYFALQTGWGSGMSMPAALIGFAIFRLAAPCLRLPFTPAENALVQTVAGASGSVSLACGFAGVIPALEFLLKPSEGAPLDLSLPRLILWSLGTCLIGSIFSTFLRTQIILREKLQFPTGTATALLISVLHSTGDNEQRFDSDGIEPADEMEGLLHDEPDDSTDSLLNEPENIRDIEEFPEISAAASNAFDDAVRGKYIQILVGAMSISAAFTVVSYFVPQIRNLPIFGRYMASHWLWTLDPSPAYIGQGAIMGTSTSLHVLLGAMIAWGVLSPLAVNRGWAPGHVDDLESGSRGWMMWIALAVLLADSILNLSWLLMRLFAEFAHCVKRLVRESRQRNGSWRDILNLQQLHHQYVSLTKFKLPLRERLPKQQGLSDNPNEIFISKTAMSVSLVIAMLICVVCIQITFGSYMKLYATILAIPLTLIASVMAIRALGETDFLPNSGIAKLIQLVFAIITPVSDPNAIVTNLLAGSMSESTTEQAGDLMQDFKTAYLLNASPMAQFQGQIIGSLFGAIISPAFYRLYASVYEIPSQLFQMPSAYLWIFTARLLMGQGLPTMALQVGSSFGLVFLLVTALKMYLARHPSAEVQRWNSFVPGGIAVAIGMYTTPSFSLPRAIGGVLTWWYMRRHPKGKTTVIIVASGLILGEGVMSILNLTMASIGVPHL